MKSGHRDRKIYATLIAVLFALSSCTSQGQEPAVETNMNEAAAVSRLRSAIYVVEDLDAAKTWYTKLLGVEPYFDEPFYVGFKIGDAELGLDPDTSQVKPGVGGLVAYWEVADIRQITDAAVESGASIITDVEDVGGIRVSRLRDPFGNVIGFLEE